MCPVVEATEKDLMQHASFWDNPDQGGGDSPVIRHAPDSDNYHFPEWDQVSKMRGSKVGAFAVIPAARKDGTSRGFDADEPGVVHVDPDAPDGGTIVDMAAVRRRDMDAAIHSSVYPHQVFYKLGTPAPLYKVGAQAGFDGPPPPEQPRVNPVMPGTYVVPRSGDGGIQMPAMGHTPPAYSPEFSHVQESRMIPSQPTGVPQLQVPQIPAASQMSAQQVQGPAPSPPQQQQPQYQQPQYQQPQQPPPPQWGGYPQPGYGMMTPPPMDPGMQQMVMQLAQAVQGLSSQVSQIQQQKQASVAPSRTAPQLATMPMPPAGAPNHGMYPIGQGPKRKRDDEEEDDVYEDDAAPIGRAPDREPSGNSMVRREGRQRLRDYERAQHDEDDSPTNALITGFETLKMPYVVGPLPLKAKRQVYFEFEGIGKQSARYHDVIESEHCLVLVYDTRYEEGTQFLPPDLGEKTLTVHVPHMKKSFVVSSMGFTYPHGVFDHIVLVKHDADNLGDLDD